MKRIVLAMGLAACAGVDPSAVGRANCDASAGCLQLERGDGGSPVMQASLNGEASFFFVLDTGASNTSLNDAAVARLGLTREPVMDQGQGMGGAVEAPLYRLSSIDAGPLSAENEIVPMFPAPSFESHDLTGIAGVTLFADRLVEWDAAAMQVRVSPSGRTLGRHEWNEISSNWIRPWKIMLPITINGVASEALLDTGAQYSVVNSIYASRAGLDVAQAQVVDEITGIDGRALPLRAVTMRAASIGAWDLGGRRVRVGDLPLFQRLGDPNRPIAILGMDWLADKEFAIDYGAQRVWLAPRGALVQ